MAPNYDRLLTRVWDKIDEKMMYQDSPDTSFRITGVNERGYYWVDYHPKLGDVRGFWPFGDRYVPMRCVGRKNKDAKLLYQHDIVKTFENCLCTVEIDEGMSAFVFQLIGDENCKFCCTPVQVGRAEIIGNEWEHPKLLHNLMGVKE